MGGEGVEVGEEEFGGNRPTAGEGEGGGAGAEGVGAEGLEGAERGSRSAGQEGQLVWGRAGEGEIAGDAGTVGGARAWVKERRAEHRRGGAKISADRNRGKAGRGKRRTEYHVSL